VRLGSTSETGSGLGLSIVSRICGLLKLKLTFTKPHGAAGLIASLDGLQLAKTIASQPVPVDGG
jgi:hypothetical protein